MKEERQMKTQNHRRNRDKHNLDSYPIDGYKQNLDSYLTNRDIQILDSYPTNRDKQNLDPHPINKEIEEDIGDNEAKG